MTATAEIRLRVEERTTPVRLEELDIPEGWKHLRTEVNTKEGDHPTRLHSLFRCPEGGLHWVNRPERVTARRWVSDWNEAGE